MPDGRKTSWLGQPWVRALHRDAGFLGIGLTLIYALSGLAVNHIADWDPNFHNYETTHELGPQRGDEAVPGAPPRSAGAVPVPLDDQAVAAHVLERLGILAAPTDVFRDGDRLDITLDQRSLHVALSTGHVIDQGQKPRFFLRMANYLHLNRGKPAWKYIADGYALMLLFLASSGLFMLPGKRGVRGRGFWFVLAGIAMPVLYVTLS